jgi:tetratricopeptide (TPR) repeat protein
MYDDKINMILMSFTTKFYSQLHRTKPALLNSIQQELKVLVQSSGGKIVRLGRETFAEFSDDSFSFTIQFFTFIQQLIPFSYKLRKLLLGYSICFYTDESLNSDNLVKKLVHVKEGIGIYFTAHLVQQFSSLFLFEPLPGTELYQLNNVKSFIELPGPELGPLVTRFRAELESSSSRCKILVGQDSDLLLYLCNTIVQQQLSDFSNIYMNINTNSPHLNGFIELFAQSMEGEGEWTSLYKEKLSYLKAERLHEMYNETIQNQLKDILDLWNNLYEHVPIILHIVHLDVLTISLQTTMKQFLINFLQSPLHYVYIIAHDKTDLDWIDEIDRHFVIIQSQHRLKYELPKEQEPYISPTCIMPILYLCHKLSLLYSKSELPLQLERSGFSQVSIRWLLDVFTKIRIFSPVISQYILPSEIEQQIYKSLQEKDRRQINYIVQERLLESLSKHELHPSLGFLGHFRNVDGKADPDLILDCVLQDLYNDYYQELEQSFQSEDFKHIIGIDVFQAIFYIVKSDHILTTGSSLELLKALQEPVPEPITNARIKAYCYINAAALHLISGDLRIASERIKTALLLLQDYKIKKGLEKVFRIFGLIELAKHHIEDSIEYLTFALDSAHGFCNNREKAFSSYYIGVAYFLQGNIPRAISFIEMAIPLFHEIGNNLWEEKCLFLLGRLQFALGNYEKASRTFEEINNIPIAIIWFLKAKLYSSIGNSFEIKHLMQTYSSLHISDTTLELEFYFFLGDYEECVRMCDTLLNSKPELSFTFIEQVDWADGYAQIESILYPQREFIYRQCVCYKALSLSILKPQDRSIVAMIDLLIDDLKPGIEDRGNYDPFDVFYYTCYYLVLQRIEATEIDRATALSSAFKRLQKRASRIEDAEIRRHYLTANYWNGLLSSAAKMHNLI